MDAPRWRRYRYNLCSFGCSFLILHSSSVLGRCLPRVELGESLLELRPEVPDEALDGPRGPVGQGADGVALDLLRQLPQHVDLLGLRVALNWSRSQQMPSRQTPDMIKDENWLLFAHRGGMLRSEMKPSKLNKILIKSKSIQCKDGNHHVVLEVFSMCNIPPL